MTDCAYCGEYLSVGEEWKLRPEIPAGTLETECEYDVGDAYMHPDCWQEYVCEP